MIVYLNGSFLPQDEARVSVLDRGFLFGDGVYEVIPAYGGRLLRLDQHLDRLEHSLDGLRIRNPCDRARWREILEGLLERNPGDDRSVYLQVTRGAAAKRDHAFPPPEVEPTVFAMVTPIAQPDPASVERGVHAFTYDDTRWSRCDIKAITLLPNVLLRQQAIDAGGQEAILIRDGLATEGAASNLFIVRNGVMTTPPKDHRVLPGITRDLVVEIAQANDLPLVEADIPVADLLAADEVWLTSSTKEVMAVTELDGRPVGDGRPGPVWRRMHVLYQDYKARLREVAAG